MKRGFTLIELLAVITVLSIIMLIAVPIVAGIIKNSKGKTREQSVELYGRAIENAISAYYVKYPLKYEVTLETLETEKLIDYKSTEVKCNIVRIEERDVYLEDCKVGNKKVDVTYGKYIPGVATDDDYRGYYADVDGDGNPDGIIYADLGATITYPQSGDWYNEKYYNWGQNDGTYTYNKATGNLNEYTISNNTYKKNDGFGENKIIKLKKDKSNPRFYVMALEDFTTTDYQTFYWYKNAYGKMTTYADDTKTDFGEGYKNTGKIIEIWNKNGTGAGSYEGATQDNRDIFKHIQEKYNSKEKWYIPSRGEWGAFADYLKKKTTNPLTHDYESGSYVENSGNYKSLYGLSVYYWSSSELDASLAWYADFDYGFLNGGYVHGNLYVRLGATF